MTEMQASLLGEVLTDIASGPSLSSHEALTEALMRRLSEKGLPLSQLMDRKMMDRSRRTLEARARQFGLRFSDYVPRALRARLVFVLRGDFYELEGEQAPKVAETLGIVVTKRRGSDVPMVGLPRHAIEDYRAKLEAAWFIVKLTKPKRLKMGATA